MEEKKPMEEKNTVQERGAPKDAVLTTQSCSNGTWMVTVVSGSGQTRARLSISYFDTEAEARNAAPLIGAAYAIAPKTHTSV